MSYPRVKSVALEQIRADQGWDPTRSRPSRELLEEPWRPSLPLVSMVMRLTVGCSATGLMELSCDCIVKYGPSSRDRICSPVSDIKSLLFVVAFNGSGSGSGDDSGEKGL